MIIDRTPAASVRTGKISRRLLCGASLAAVLACGIPGVAQAEDRYWDANGTAVGSGGTGTWNLANLNWSPNGDGVSGPFVEPWDNGDVDNAIFGGTAGTVTVGVPVTVGNITFSSAGYILNGSRITLGGANSTITTTTGNSQIDSVLAGSNGLIKAGGGGLILNGVNSFTGDIHINAGSLYAGSDAALGAAGNNIFTGAGITTRLSIAGAGSGRMVTIGNGGTLIVEGAATGAAQIRGNGSVQLAASGVTMSNDLSDYTGRTVFAGCNGTCSTRFTSIGNLGEASSLGAPVTVADGTIIFNQQSQYSDSLIYLGNGDSSNRNWDINGNAALIRNQGTGTLELTGDIDISVAGGFYAETADFRLLGTLSGGDYAFNASAGRNVQLGNANIFTGDAALAGEIRVGKLADIGSASSLGAGTTISLVSGTLGYDGAGDASNREWLVNGPANAIQNNGSGALNLSGALLFNAASPNPDTLTLGGSFAGTSVFSGIMSGNGNLVVDSAGTWELSGANIHRGTVTVNGGTLRAGSAGAFGATTGLVVNGGTLDLGNFDLIAPSLTGTGGTVALGSQTLTIDAKTAQAFGGTIAGSGGLRKAGAGTLTLTGANSYTGATTIGAGKLSLNFSGTGGPANDIVSASSALVLSGGTLEVLGAAGETNTQNFNGLTVNAGSSTVSAISGAGGAVNLNLGTIVRAGGLVNFVLPTGGAITTSNADGVLGGWATINGSDYAKVVGGGILAFDNSDYTNKDDAGTWANSDIISDTANAANSPFFGTVTGNVQLGGLRYTAAADSIVTIGAGNTLGIDGTIIVAPSTLAKNQTITGGSLTGGAGGGTLGVQQNGTGVFTIASTIVDNGGTSFAKSGNGTVRLDAVNSYAGGTTLSGGRLEVASLANGGANSSIGASSAASSNLVLESGTLAYVGGVDAVSDRGITLVNGGAERAIQVDTGRTVEFSGLVTSPDDAGLTKTGFGTLVLSNAANDYTGVTTITGGAVSGPSTLSVNTLSDGGSVSGIGAATSDSANLVMINGGRLQYTGGSVAIDRGFTLAGGLGGIDVAQAGTTLTVGGVATGAGSFLKAGAGILVLSGTNTYTGDTVIDAGTLRAGSARAFGPGTRYITVNGGATLDLGGFNITAGGVAGAGTVTLGSRTLTTAGGSAEFTGRITGTGGFTRGAGSYTQTLSGCTNDYTGVTTISGGLAIDCIANGGQASGIGASSAAAANLVLAGGTLAYTGASASTDRGFAMTGNGAFNIVNAATVLEFSGNVTGGGQLQKTGAGTLLLSGNNSSTGSVRIYGGTLRAGSTTAFGSGGIQFENAPGTTLDLDGYDNSVAFLITTGSALGGAVALGDATLTITNGGSAGVVFGGAISGSGGLIKTGGGFQQLSGCSSSYGGTTVINQGILAVACLGDGGANSSIGSSSSAAGNLVLSGGTLQYVGTGGSTNRQFTLGASTTSKLDASGTGAIAFTNAGPLTFASANTAQTLTLGGTNSGNNILAAQITNNGTGLTRLTKNDAGTWILTNAGSTYTGITTINGGVLGVDKLADGGVASSIGASSAAAANLVIGNGSTLRYTGAGDTTNRLFTLSAGVTFIESSGTGAIVFTDTGPVTLASNNQARTIALGGTNSGNNTLAGSIGNAGTGTTTLAKNDSGTWVLTGNHSYTGSTNVNGGTLFIGGGGTTGSIASAIVNNFGTLGFNRSDLLSYGGQIVGTGSLRQAGTGTTVLTGTNLYTGGTTIDAGTLQLGNGGATGSIVGDVVDNGLLVFNRSSLFTLAGFISGSGAVQQIGSGTTVLSGINSYAGGTSILGGTLQVSADANLGDAAGGLIFSNGTLRTTASFTSARDSSLTGAGTILTDAGTTFALSGVMSGAGSLTKSGAGVLTLGGNNSYAGATNINAGTLRINGDQSAATGLVTVASGATLGGNGTIGGNVNVLNGGILAPGNSPGTLTINGDLALAGGSVLNFEFGQAGVAGGPLNDLVDVGGNLTLDGTINVNVSAGGNFGGGIYRVFNYGGALTDNGLALGSMPAGSNVTVQTSVAGQVNLINSDGLSLSFWDGDAGAKFNDVIDGGNGSWHLSGADNNWTGGDGSINAAYADGTYAIFAGAPGTVTVDNSGGAVTATGMQFATDGYTINGAPLTLVGPQSLVRVGDGTAAGADFTATISASLTGNSQLVKTDAGTLVLAAANSYTGGTLINGGVLSVAADSFLGASTGGVMLDGGTLRLTDPTFSSARAFGLGAAGGAIEVTNPTTNAFINAGVTGSGGLTKLGAGTLQLAGANSYTGGTTIEGGILLIGSLGVNTTASIVGDVVNNGTLRLGRSDAYTYGGSITGTGLLDIVSIGVTTLTGNSSYGGGTRVNGLGGELRIVGGAKVASGGATTMGRSTLSIDGAGSEFSTTALGGNIAFAGSTIVNVTGGGTLRITAGDIDLRTTAASTQVNITGANSVADVSGGIRGSSTFNTPFNLTVGAGGTLRTAGASQIGTAASNTNPLAVAITGTGSNWTSSGSLLMTRGNFTVDQGGAASFASATFGAAPQTASLSVSGANSSFATTGDLVIGSGGGTGVLTLTDDGQADVGGTLILADNAAATGTLNIGGVEGGPAAAAGIVNGAITFGPGAGALNFNHVEADYLFANTMSGAGTINHAAGITRLTGDSSAFTGTTSVAGGTLLVDGVLGDAASLVSVATGGTLGGNGTIGGNVDILDGNLNPGNIGGVPGRLTIAGNLNLAPAATLNVDFGQANVVGGALNDLIEVGGDLTLDGTLNVAVPPGGSFDPGLYRIINYGGSLIDNGLTADSGYFVQTSVANQVNLVNTTGLTMRFWDGVNGAKNDGAITGGDGLWQASGGNDNWTEYDGSANAPFTDDAFAVFSGVGGTVTVDGSLGTVSASGMQFASDGYIIAGDDITLVDPAAIIRVGDGSVGGAAYTATIASNLTGIGDLIKSDLGTLVLTGTNGFAGETNARGGELRLADGGTLTNADGVIGRESGEQGIVTVIGADGSGNASTWTSTGYLRVGGLGTGTLNILDGGRVHADDTIYVGDDVGSQGIVNVSGQDANGNASTWTGARDISIGEFGNGTLNITAGGQVSNESAYIGSNAGALGVVTVSGVGTNGVASTWINNGDLFVGYDGNGTLNITDGGKVVSNVGNIAANDGGGQVLVSGAGSSWENSGRINVGLFGAGTLRIENGASVINNDGIVGASAQGDAVVSGAGTSWINAQQLNVGSFGDGTLRIENGATVTSNQGYIGANATGSVVVTGAGSNWLVTDFSMTVGNDGAGSLMIENGGLVRVEGGFSLGNTASASGTVIVTGAAGSRGVLETSGIDAGLGTVNFSLDGGILRATDDNDGFFADFDTHDITLGANGGIIDTDGYDIGISPNFVGAGGLTKDGLGTLTLTGANSYAGATLVNAGTLLVNGDQSAATGLTTIFSGATLGGNGIIGGNVDIRDGAILAPGESAGTLTINGDLSLAGGSILAYEFGQANVAGGALNDLVNVGGDLVLDGTIDVSVSAGGTFGPGIYRVINYGGALTDNGLALGTIAGGTGGVSVQTSIGGQVNLVNAQGLALSFWDGAAGPKNDNVLNGGDGVWRIADGSGNWTDANGTINADYAQDSFAIFAAAPGTVTIDNGGGNVLASGMQFASDGYVLTGDALTLTGAQAIVQVGDSSAAGAGYTATIDADVTGTAMLVKTDAGTLVLSGTNSYSGGTVINGGTIRISSDANLGDAAGSLSFGDGTLNTIASFGTARAIDLAGAGTVVTDAVTTLNLDGLISGSGALIKRGDGILTLTADNGYTGGTTIAAGSLQIGNGGTTGSVVGDIVDNGELILARSDSYTIAGQISGTGAVRKGGGTAIFTANNSYTGGTTNASGILQLGDGGTSGNIVGDIVNGGTLRFNRSNELVFAGVISGLGSFEQTGSGTTILTGGNSYAGATNVTAGTLLVNGDQSAATGLTSVAGGATLGGSGVIGGNVALADGATLTPGAGAPGALTINGNLAMASDATLGFEFGRANDVGGPLNDVVNVGGDLLLDGTLNVSVPTGGAFDIGLYRVINYGGTLTDNGLALGTLPAGANAQVQTSIAGEVNLINTGSATLNFWDGAAGPKFDNAVNGGDGIWQNSLGNNNWADISGAVNAGYDDGAFAIFSGTAGIVTIDNSLGAVSASGMQFAVDGYRITGDALTLDGAQAVIRVGDGTAAGGAYVATIDAELTGAAGLIKTDAGTLVLTGSNSYAGGTLINGGTLQIGADDNLGAAAGALGFDGGTLRTTATFTSARDVDLIGTGGFLTDAGTTLTLAGALSGTGSFTKSGDGTLVLGGSGTFGGGTVASGTMFVNGDYAAAGGTTSVLAGATLGGTGTIGGNVAFANGATLSPGAGAAGTLTISGDLSLSATTQLDFEFGAAGVVGGALNDLVNVGGNLVLDGVLNVGVPAGGAFDVGVYRMFNYGGALTNNGVRLGTLPGGANANVQTSIAGQVNLVNSAGLTLNFWDGAAGPKNNGVINGGSGVWQNSGGNDNWTGEDGAVNAAYSDGAFAIFGGTGGTVTVDNSLGAVTAAGMQFAATNYVVGGGAIELTDATATIRVGDGSAAGAGFTATINSALSGAAQLVKSDAGTLVLGGTNSYTGGTQIVGGTLRISSDANLGAADGAVTLDGGTLETSATISSARDIVVVSGGTIATAADTVFTYEGLFSGAGVLTKNGAGTLLVTADNSGFGGGTTVAGGTLAVQGILGGTVTVGAAGRLEGAGRVGSIANTGVVAPGRGIGSLTVAGDYAGNGGALEIEAELGGDASASDRLIVNGATSGNTRVTVINRDGLGAQTVEGIKIVDVAGASNGNFTLDGDYLFDGQQAVVAGAYGYRLYKNGVSTPQDGDWYLRSSRLDGTGNPQGPLYQPGVPVYEAYVGALQSLNRLPTLQQRVGNRSWAASPIAGAGLWGRFESERQRPEALVSTSGADRKADQWQAQLGLDAVLAQRADGAALVGGLTAHYGKADSSVTSIFGDGTIDTQGYGVGATMTWYGPKGLYVDGQVKLSWFDSDLESNILGSLIRNNKGDGQAFSLELGKQTAIGRNLSITPQVQMSYAKVDFDRFADPAAAAVSVAKGESLKTRWGLAIDHQTSWKGRSGDTRRTRLYTVMNLSYEWLDGAVADVSGTPIINRDHRLSGELGLGGSYSWGDDRFTLYTEVSGDTAIADFGAGYNLKGTAGVRVRF